MFLTSTKQINGSKRLDKWLGVKDIYHPDTKVVTAIVANIA